jgi:hypothetical protein
MSFGTLVCEGCGKVMADFGDRTLRESFESGTTDCPHRVLRVHHVEGPLVAEFD